MTTLASATLDLARLIGDVVDSTATQDGSTASSIGTLIDGSFPKRDYTGAVPSDDFYNYGTIWFISGTSTGGSNLNDGCSRIITDFESSTATFTFGACDSETQIGNTYAVTESIWPRYKLRAFVNLALQSIRAVPALDTSVTTVANTETYALPTGVYNVRHIQIAESLSTPYYFNDYYHGYWEEKNSLIYFKPGYWPQTTGYTMRLWYQATHTNLTTDTASISSYIDPMWLAWESVVHAYRWRRPLTEGGKPDELVMKEAFANAGSYRRKYMELLPKLPGKVKLANWFGDSFDSPEFDGTVRV